jgi:hypothetical protein
MDTADALRISDAAVVARCLQLRSRFHDGLLTRVIARIEERYQVLPTRRIPATMVALVQSGFVRPGEGELWPVVFLTPVDITLALAVQISAERLAGLGTLLNGPQRLRHRLWEDWWGWETTLGGCHPSFFELPATAQDEAMLAWYTEGLEWLAHSGLLRKK